MRRERFFESYVNDLLDRGVTQLADIQRRSDMHRLLRLGRGFDSSADGDRPAGSGAPTSRIDDTPLPLTLRGGLLIERVPAWSATATKRASRASKTMFVDTGLGAHLAGRGIDRLQRDEALAGPVLENLVLSELEKQVSWSMVRPWLGHHRTPRWPRGRWCSGGSRRANRRRRGEGNQIGSIRGLPRPQASSPPGAATIPSWRGPVHR